MADALEGLEKQLKRRNFDSPPLHLWHPELSGDIPIRITADGSWYHDGTLIRRESLVRLFASILRREQDGQYYLVTPVEKWRISVELHPLTITDISVLGDGETGVLQATLNTGAKVEIGERHSLFFEPTLGDIPAIKLDHGLTAVCSRAAWYRLVDLARDCNGVPVLSSGDYHFALVP